MTMTYPPMVSPPVTEPAPNPPTTTTLLGSATDFTVAHKRIVFTIDGDEFELVPDLPVLSLIDFATLADDIGGTAKGPKMKQLFHDVYNLILIDESAELFITRMQDKARPINMDQASQILNWAMEQFGMRPTEPSSDSSPQSSTPADGQPSTVNSAPPESTSAPSPFPGS